MPPLLVGNGELQRHVLRKVVLCAVALFAIAGVQLSVGAPTSVASSAERARFRPGAVLIGFRAGVSGPARHAIERAVGAHGAMRLGPAVKPAGHGRVRSQEFLAPYEIRVPVGSVSSVVGRLRRAEGVAYAEPDYLMHGTATPNDS